MLMGRYADKIVTVSQAVANHIKQSLYQRYSYGSDERYDNAVYYSMDVFYSVKI